MPLFVNMDGVDEIRDEVWILQQQLFVTIADAELKHKNTGRTRLNSCQISVGTQRDVTKHSLAESAALETTVRYIPLPNAPFPPWVYNL